MPAHWSVLTHLWSDHRTPTVVSSGAFFGKERAAELFKHKESFDRYFEILGSTETWKATFPVVSSTLKSLTSNVFEAAGSG
ncbi:MAG: hypothetical protein H7318_17790 [Oligoflexus sp.]|nr:hypothetical protein [Oligoflexus sp.]